ncbi:hypothetical protein SUGI_0199630 [Cryptomeria japonica]|uniref:E3 ubiquitin-protein ligase PUB23-like n=1 Tax=Cryptomeria japonica TaxID=3369 RepID=UPI002408E4D8|nr:E3 ubiquitin-protein ligase PUB23-like [Cryptomeria japonica]GLJ12871.1 hypothetical protein SUGI_0199630 [Cryptomeria japonica]
MASDEKPKRLCNDRRIGSSIPKFLCCPLSGKLMRDPVKTDSGTIYDRSSIQEWLDKGNIHCFITGKQISRTLISNRKLQLHINEWKRLYPQIKDAAQNEVEGLLQKLRNQEYRRDKLLNILKRLRILLKRERWPPQELQKYRPGDILADKLASTIHLEDRDEAAEEIICMFKYLLVDFITMQKIMNPRALGTVVFAMRNGKLKRRIEAVQLINRVTVVDQVGCLKGLIKGLLELLDCSLVDCTVKACTMITLRRFCRRGEIKQRLKEEGVVRIVRRMWSNHGNDHDQVMLSRASELLQVLLEN